MSNGKAMVLLLIAGQLKKTLYQATQYFPKPYVHFRGNVEVESDLSNYETKVGLKGAARVDTSNLAAKSD